MVLVERQVLGYCETADIRLSRDQTEDAAQPLHSHPSAACAIADQFGIGKIGRVEEMFVKHVDVRC